MISQLRLQPVKKGQSSPEIDARFEDIQDTMGIPWPPANWRTYAMYPGVMQLFWERLRPAVDTEAFLRDALMITERAYYDTAGWYSPGYHPELPDEERQRIQWEIDALEFGNPQLLIQQAALSRAIRGEVVGQKGAPQLRRYTSVYRQPEIVMVDEQDASDMVKRLYQDIKQTLKLPLVNSDYQALAKWPTFLRSAWEDAKQWRQRDEYQRLQREIARMGDDAARRLCPPLRIDERELRNVLSDPGEFANLQQIVPMFTYLLPGLIVNDALFRIGVAGGRPVKPPQPEGFIASGV